MYTLHIHSLSCTSRITPLSLTFRIRTHVILRCLFYYLSFRVILFILTLHDLHVNYTSRNRDTSRHDVDLSLALYTLFIYQHCIQLISIHVFTNHSLSYSRYTCNSLSIHIILNHYRYTHKYLTPNTH